MPSHRQGAALTLGHSVRASHDATNQSNEGGTLSARQALLTHTYAQSS